MNADFDARRTLRGALLAGTVLAGLMGGAGVAAAQDATGPQATDVDEIVITGSRIRRDATNAPTPLIQIGQEEVLQSGEVNVIDFLADIPALSFSQVPEDTTGSNLNDGGLSLLNLRGLGSVRTLVLVDGRRHVGSSPGSPGGGRRHHPAPADREHRSDHRRRGRRVWR
jgi:outer membrane receptor for ferrienterochelin and colicin